MATRLSDDLRQANRNKPVSPALALAVSDALDTVYGSGYSFKARSGVVSRPSLPGGSSGRHVLSTQELRAAADWQIYDPNGRQLRGAELTPLAKHWVANYGSIGVNATAGDYMGKQWTHLDLIRRPGNMTRVWTYGNIPGFNRQQIASLAGTGEYYDAWADPRAVIAQSLGLPKDATIADIQKHIGANPDGTYGPETIEKLEVALADAPPLAIPETRQVADAGYSGIPVPEPRPDTVAFNTEEGGGDPLGNAVIRDTKPMPTFAELAERAKASTALSSIISPNPDAPRLDAYQSGYGNPAPAMAAPVSPVGRGGTLGPASFGGDPVLANAGGFVSPLGDMVTNPDGLPDPNTMPSENMPFVPLGDPSKGNVVTGLAEGGGMQLAPLDSAYPVTPGDPLASLTPEQAQIAAENYRAEQGFDLGPQNGRPNNAPQSNDDPLRGALTQMAAESTNIPVPTPRPSIEPVPQERPALYASGADIPIPVDRPQTQTAGAPVNAPTTDPWTGMRASADPLSSLVSSYAPIDPMITGGFAQNLAYAQANPSQIDVDPALMDPALGAPVDPLAPAVKAPVQPLTPPVEVRAYPVKEAAPEARQAQKWNVPSGMDVWQGASNYGRATDGSTLSRNPDGSVSRYSEKYDRWDTYNPQTDMWTPGGDDPLAGALGGMGLSKGGLSSDGKQTSNIKNILKGALVGGKVGGLPGAAVGALVGGNAQNIANQGGFLSKAVGAMFGVQSDPYASLERQARQAAGGKFQSGSSNPSDYSYSPAAHDAIAAGKGGLF